MKYELKPVFDRSFRKKSLHVQKKVRAAIESILTYFDKRASLRPGLGLKNFLRDYWEIRIDIHERIIFQLTDRIIFWFVGNHDEIRRFMKNK